MTLPAPGYNTAGTSYACFPFFSPVGYLTLYVVVRQQSLLATEVTLTVHTLQHAEVFDAATLATNQYFRCLFPTATFLEHRFPTELASDFHLLGAYAYGTLDTSFLVSQETLAALRDRALDTVMSC